MGCTTEKSAFDSHRGQDTFVSFTGSGTVVLRLRMVELYLYSPIRLHGAVLN
jgi:hypothetical protein